MYREAKLLFLKSLVREQSHKWLCDSPAWQQGKDLELGATIHWTMSPPLWRAAVQDFGEGSRSFITPRPFQDFVVWKLNRNFHRNFFLFCYKANRFFFNNPILCCLHHLSWRDGMQKEGCIKKLLLLSAGTSVLPTVWAMGQPTLHDPAQRHCRNQLLPKGVSNQNNFNNINRYILNRGNQSLHRKFGHQRIKGKPIPSEKIKLAVV